MARTWSASAKSTPCGYIRTTTKLITGNYGKLRDPLSSTQSSWASKWIGKRSTPRPNPKPAQLLHSPIRACPNFRLPGKVHPCIGISSDPMRQRYRPEHPPGNRCRVGRIGTQRPAPDPGISGHASAFAKSSPICPCRSTSRLILACAILRELQSLRQILSSERHPERRSHYRTDLDIQPALASCAGRSMSQTVIYSGKRTASTARIASQAVRGRCILNVIGLRLKVKPRKAHEFLIKERDCKLWLLK